MSSVNIAMAANSQRSRLRRPYHHGDLRNALLAKAQTLLERDGPAVLSFRGIARAVGVSQTAPYNHFPDKEHLLVALATIGLSELKARQIAAAAASQPEARLEAIGRAYIHFARENPQMYRLMFGETISEWHRHPAAVAAKHDCFQPAREAWADELRSHQDTSPAEAETAAIAGWSVVHGLAMLMIDGVLQEGSDDEALITAVIRWHLRGL